MISEVLTLLCGIHYRSGVLTFLLHSSERPDLELLYFALLIEFFL